jgi:hypothetical protein
LNGSLTSPTHMVRLDPGGCGSLPYQSYRPLAADP